MAQTLANVAVGTVVKLNENGSPVEFYVACQDYQSDLNGSGRTLLVRKKCYDARVWKNQPRYNTYYASDIDSWLNSSYKANLDSNIQTAISTTKFYSAPGHGNYTPVSLERSVFILSMVELNADNSAPIEGSPLPIASILQSAKLNGQGYQQWSRTPSVTISTDVKIVSAMGINGLAITDSLCGSRPCFTLPGSTTYVLEDGTITLNQPPSAPGSIDVPTVAAGQPCAITWTAATDPDGTIASYILERSVNGSGWTQVFSGNALTYTDTIGEDWGAIQYRVCAVDNYGASGPYATSETQTVQDGILYISGPASAMGNKVAPFAFAISTGVSGSSSAVTDVAVEISLDGNQIYSGTVDTGDEISVTIDTRTIGGGSHTIEATASKTDYISAAETYTFTTPSLSLPDGGLGVQLQDEEGRAVFPQSVAALIAGLNGKSVAGNLQDLLPSVADLTANRVRVETGSYVGTGQSGQATPNTLTFDFEPKFLYVSAVDQNVNNANMAFYMVVSKGVSSAQSEHHAGTAPTGNCFCDIVWGDNSVSWYNTGNNTQSQQLNQTSTNYCYIAIG